jgi:lambda repressor-like predicted transcriptional regulator
MNREQQFNFAAFFTAKLKERGLTLRKLSELSGISAQDLQNLSEGDFDHLPAAPYLRGYTIKLAKILEFDPDIWWQYFEAIGALKSSGETDYLPQNRFAIGKRAQYGWVIAVVVILVLYGGLRFSKILGRPTLIVLEPSESPVTVTINPMVIHGTLTGGDTLTMNGEAVMVADDGNWEKSIALEEGLNTISVKASKRLGKSVEDVLQIVYEAPASPSSSSNTSGSNASGTPPSD